MTEQMFTVILQTYGPLGAVLIFAGWALNTLYKQITEVHEKRIADAQAATTKLLELVAEQHGHMDALAKAIDGGADASSELRRMLEQMLAERGDVRRLLEELATDRNVHRRLPRPGERG